MHSRERLVGSCVKSPCFRLSLSSLNNFGNQVHNWKCDSEELFERKLVVSFVLHSVYGQGSSEKGLM